MKKLRVTVEPFREQFRSVFCSVVVFLLKVRSVVNVRNYTPGPFR